MQRKTIFSSIFIVLVTSINAFAQVQQDSVTFDNTMRSNGKIYVVVAVVVTIFLVLIGYMINTEKKVNRLAKEIKK